MTDRDAFIRAILQNPADDTVRLIFADWLDENGEPERAEFVRVQCELARHPDATCELRRRESHLWAHRTAWIWVPYGFTLGLWSDIFTGNTRPCIVRRGFVDEICCPLNVFLEHAEELFRNHPVTRVVLTDVQPTPVLPETGWGFERLAGRRGWQDHELPDDIWIRLPSGDFPNPLRRWYQTRERADAYLSAACVAYGRERAGLPAL